MAGRRKRVGGGRIAAGGADDAVGLGRRNNCSTDADETSSDPTVDRRPAARDAGSAGRRRPNRRLPSAVPATCALLAAAVAVAGAFRNAAFVTRIGPSGGGPPKTSAKYRDDPGGAGGAGPNGGRTARAFETFEPRGGATWMARSPDTEEAQASPSSSDTDDDEDEWGTVLAAFRMYKAAYGDLKVPSRFVVPGMAPWPEPAWKMKLGQRVAAIRSTGRYVQNDEGRRKALDDMGFLWRLRSPSPGKRLDGIAFEQVDDALKTYRSEIQPSGILDVPPNFVVPDCEPWPDSTRGLPLGKIVPTVRSKSYLERHPEARAALTSLGFAPDVGTAANDLRYRRVYDALVRYKEIHGDLLVPQPFTVPESDGDGAREWPEEVRGLRLGARVNAIRSQGTFVRADPRRREELDDLGFVWEPPANADGKKRGRKRKGEASTAAEKEAAGVDGAGDKRDDASEAAPPAFATVGRAFDAARDPFFTGDQSSPPQWAFEGEEEEDGSSPSEREGNGGNYAAPKSFNETLEEMADVAMEVGIMERWTANKRVVKGARNKYVPWRNDDFGSDFVFEDVVEALVLYKELYGNFDGIEEEEFVVPEPVEESLRLSPFELAAMNDDSPEELDDMDGPWDEDGDGEGGLEGKFSVVASKDWPEHLAGMKLGQIVSRIRDGGLEVKHLPERKRRLDDVGFDWGDPRRFVDVPFEKVMCALYAYFMIRGDTFVMLDFVMPDKSPWPTVLAGFELGAAVARLRELQNFLEAYHPVKMSLLRMVDFCFFPELAKPLDPDADVTDAEHLYVETFGHPLYHISTVPLGLPERMLADGPDGSPERLSSWYNYEYVREFHERPGALTDVADWMRDIGFHRLAEEHERKYGRSHYRQLFLLKEKLDRKEISQDVWDQEIDRIKDEVMEEFENWRRGESGNAARAAGGMGGDGEFDYNVNEDEYYYQTLELASSSSQDPSRFEPPTMIPNDVIEESVAEFSLGPGDGGED